MKKFSETQPKLEPETDRAQLKRGDTFILTGFVNVESKKFPLGIMRINGLSKETGYPVKYWTTGVAIHNQLLNIGRDCGVDAGELRERVDILVSSVKTKNGEYLTFVDPV